MCSMSVCACVQRGVVCVRVVRVVHLPLKLCVCQAVARIVASKCMEGEISGWDGCVDVQSTPQHKLLK